MEQNESNMYTYEEGSSDVSVNKHKRDIYVLISLVFVLTITILYVSFQYYQLKKDYEVIKSDISALQEQPVNETTVVEMPEEWREYSRDMHDYKVSYPSNWFVKELVDKVIEGGVVTDYGLTSISSYDVNEDNIPEVRAKVEINVRKNPDMLTATEWYEKLRESAQEPENIISDEVIIIDGENALKKVHGFENNDGSLIAYTVYISKGDKMYTVWCGGDKSFGPILHKMVTSMTFSTLEDVVPPEVPPVETSAVWKNPTLTTCKLGVGEPIKQYPHESGLTDDERIDPEGFTDFCERMATKFETSGIDTDEAETVYNAIAEANFIMDESFGQPSDMDPPLVGLTLEKLKERVQVKKVEENKYEIFYRKTGCGHNFRHESIDIHVGEITNTQPMERWSLSSPC